MQLRMHDVVRELAVQGGWEMRALLRASKFFTMHQVIMLYKPQVLLQLEVGCVAFIHAPLTTMMPLDRLQ